MRAVTYGLKSVLGLLSLGKKKKFFFCVWSKRGAHFLFFMPQKAIFLYMGGKGSGAEIRAVRVIQCRYSVSVSCGAWWSQAIEYNMPAAVVMNIEAQTVEMIAPLILGCLWSQAGQAIFYPEDDEVILITSLFHLLIALGSKVSFSHIFTLTKKNSIFISPFFFVW